MFNPRSFLVMKSFILPAYFEGIDSRLSNTKLPLKSPSKLKEEYSMALLSEPDYRLL